MSQENFIEQKHYALKQDCRYYDGIWEDTQRFLGLRLLRERKKQRLSQTSLGDVISYSSSTISLLERGQLFARMHCYLQTCVQLGLMPGRLIDEAMKAACFAREQKRDILLLREESFPGSESREQED